jgi:hypothetical protein
LSPRIIDPEAEVMDADKIRSTFVASVVLIAELQERKIHNTVRQPRCNDRL